MAYIFVEVDKTLGSTHSGSSGSTRTTTSSSASSGVDLRNWVKNVLIIGDPIAVLNSGDPDFLPTVAQMYQEGDPDVVESLTDWYPELKPVVENYIASNSAVASTTTNSGSSSSRSGSGNSDRSSSAHTETFFQRLDQLGEFQHGQVFNVGNEFFHFVFFRHLNVFLIFSYCFGLCLYKH